MHENIVSSLCVTAKQENYKSTPLCMGGNLFLFWSLSGSISSANKVAIYTSRQGEISK